MALKPPFDSRVILAMNLVTQPGVYALLLGSGISTAAGIPTGWGVVEQLVRQVAAGAMLAPIVDDGWEGWWKEHYPGVELGYSNLLEVLGPTAAVRTALLSQFFNATSEERETGLKVPGDAHAAIAELIARGTIRLVITTNFDRLLEQALDAKGVSYQVIASNSAIAGMEPLPHADVTIIKLHGDYTSLAQRNTVEELSNYPPETTELLERIFEEYGLVIAGWSGEWDHALLGLLESHRGRRYPLVWTTWREGGAIAKSLTSGHGNVLVENAAADDFFPDLLSRVAAIEDLADTPPSLEVKLARLRRALPDPMKYLELRALFERELDALRAWVAERPRAVATPDAQVARDHVASIRRRFDSLLQLFTQGVLLDRDRQHSDLWVWVLQQALDARPGSLTGAITPWWDSLAHLPAYLLLRVGVLASLAAQHEDVMVRLCLEPRWSTLLVQHGAELPAHEVLHVHRVFEKAFWSDVLLITDKQRWLWPGSHLTRAELLSVAEGLFGASGAERALGRMEYRLALASALLRPGLINTYHSPAAGNFVLFDRYRPDDEAQIALTSDFLERGDTRAWQDAALPAPEDFNAAIMKIDDRLRKLRNDTE
jgi:hypothetical protein